MPSLLSTWAKDMAMKMHAKFQQELFKYVGHTRTIAKMIDQGQMIVKRALCNLVSIADLVRPCYKQADLVRPCYKRQGWEAKRNPSSINASPHQHSKQGTRERKCFTFVVDRLPSRSHAAGPRTTILFMDAQPA